MSHQNRHEAIAKLKRYFYYFVTFSCLGWVWEVIVCLIVDGRWENPGTLRGPWAPIYGFGMVLFIIIYKWVKQPWAMFLIAFCLSGVIEYFVALVLENLYHVKWWDYSDFLLNFQGRICVEGLLLFAAAACLLVYFVVSQLEKFYYAHNGLALDFILMLCFIGLLVDTGYLILIGPNTQHVYNVSENLSINTGISKIKITQQILTVLKISIP